MSSVVRFNITQRTAEGARVPIVDGGRVVLEPTRLIVVEGDPDEIVIPARITVPLVDGRVDVPMDATGVAWCWRIVVRGARRDPLQEGYYTIPESATPLDYPTDLVEVDPKTFAPAESAVPAWEAAVEAVQGREEAAALAATQAAGSASSAAASAQSAANSASSASGSAGTATTKATEAGTSATNAASSASAANLSATNADASKTAAAGSATSAADSASQAASSAGASSTKATEATNSAASAAISAATASTKASEATSSASAASASATAAASSAATASAAQAATEAVDITVGTVTTGAPGTPAAAAILGTAPTFTLDLTIPEGEQGDPGPVNSLSIGTVTTGAAGSSASASITGTAPEQTLNLTLPKGDAGGIVNPSLLPNGGSIDDLASGLYHAQYAGSIANGYPVEGFIGYLMVGSRSSSYRFQVAYSAQSDSRGAVWVRVRANSTTWHPWVLQHSTGAVGGGDLTGTGMPNGVVSAPPGSYYTDTAGTNGAWRWLKKSGTGNTGWECIVGDTGWRNLSSIAVNSWVGTMRVRRIGSACSLLLDYVRSGTAVEVLTLPEGFRPPANIKTSVIGGGATQSIYLSASGVLTKQNIAHSGPNGGGEIWDWSTNDPWPTTLPGTPA